MVTALSNMAAAARPPGIGDARVPCPLCGGLVHPVAGRCKHCKEDLSSLRANRPQAAAVLPALNGRTVATHVAGNGTSVHAAAAAAPVAAPVAIAGEGSAPILPQRTTGRSMSAQRARGSLLRNWPMIVIILAMLAIVTAVVIMVLPADRKGGGKRQLMPTPAPDRMQTDPWAQPGGPGTNGPQGSITPDPQPQPRITPDPPRPATPPDDPDDPDDLYGGLGGPSGMGGMIGGAGSFAINLADAACKKLKSCPNADSLVTDQMCQGIATMPKPALGSCASGQRCLDAIERMDCDITNGTRALNDMMSLGDCARAMTEC